MSGMNTQAYCPAIEPASGHTVAMAPAATANRLIRAEAPAKRPLGSWRTAPEEARQAACRVLAERIEPHAASLVRLMTLRTLPSVDPQSDGRVDFWPATLFACVDGWACIVDVQQFGAARGLA